ncbi:MAG: hybrid sensor histidine kinase/response regulator, partial [Christiangramia sp.]
FGFNEKLLKPYRPNELKQAIAAILKLRYKDEKVSESLEHGKLKSDNYDLSDIYEFSGQDDEAMQTILQAFLEGAGNSIKELEAAYKQKDIDKMGRIAHRMLPMLRQMRAKEVITVLRKLEARETVSKSEFNHFQKKFKDLMLSLEADITV